MTDLYQKQKYYDVQDACSLLKEIKRDFYGCSILIIAAEKSIPDIRKFQAMLNECGIIFGGALFSEIIYGNEFRDSGVIVKKISEGASIDIIDIDDYKKYSYDILNIYSSRLFFYDASSEKVYEFYRFIKSRLDGLSVFIGVGEESVPCGKQARIFDNHDFAYDAVLSVSFTEEVKVFPLENDKNSFIDKDCGDMLDHVKFIMISKLFKSKGSFQLNSPLHDGMIDNILNNFKIIAPLGAVSHSSIITLNKDGADRIPFAAIAGVKHDRKHY